MYPSEEHEDDERPVADSSGELYTIAAFVQSCRENPNMDYEGIGYYSNGQTYNVGNRAFPADMRANLIDQHWGFVLWFSLAMA